MKIKESNFLQELRKGNQDGLSYIITKYGGFVMSILHKHLYLMVDKQEECFDDIFINIWNHIEQFDENQTSFKNWIAGISKNKAIDYLRKYKRELEEIALEEDVLSSNHQDILPMIENEITQETEKLLDCLSKEEQELLIKLYVDEIPIETLAKESNISKTTMYKRISRSKQKIRNKYQRREI